MSYIQGEYQIIRKSAIAGGIFDYTVKCPEIVKEAKAGQFVHIRAKGFTLRRPISICQISKEKGSLRLVFEVRGKGTEEIAKLNVGENMDILAPLGNGFTLLEKDKKAIVIGGGIGVPPMLETAAHYDNATAILGFRSASAIILDKDFEAVGADVKLSTDDGTKGHKGFVTDILKKELENTTPDIVYACGPNPMLKAIAEICKAKGIRCQVSLEERMGCGVGACLVCACKIAAEKGETYKHVCKDGPIFEAEEVLF